MKYDINEFTVKPGKKVKLIFANPDFMPHNLVFTKPNKADSVAQQALTLGAQGFAMAFGPKSEDVLWASQLVITARRGNELYGSNAKETILMSAHSWPSYSDAWGNESPLNNFYLFNWKSCLGSTRAGFFCNFSTIYKL